MADWTIRRAAADDAGALTAVIGRAYAIYDGRGIDLPPVCEGVADDIAKHRVFVAETHDTIVGGLVLDVDDGVAHLVNVAVDPGLFGQGIGRALIAQAEAEARGLGIAELHLTTHVGLPENVRLYARLGWSETERSENKVHMSKRL